MICKATLDRGIPPVEAVEEVLFSRSPAWSSPAVGWVVLPADARGPGEGFPLRLEPKRLLRVVSGFSVCVAAKTVAKINVGYCF